MAPQLTTKLANGAPGEAGLFYDLDVDENFLALANSIKDINARNFVVDFGKDEALAAVDIEESRWPEVLDAERPLSRSTRWIHIFAPNLQTNLVKQLKARYGFSRRLEAIMCQDPMIPRTSPPDQSHGQLQHLRDKIRGRRGSLTGEHDLEKEVDAGRAKPRTLELPDLNHYRLVDEVWHYCSVDWGDKFLCIGYNALQSGQTMASSSSHLNPDTPSRDVPDGKRVWVWLVLCYDGTVISLYEDAFPRCGDGSNPPPIGAESSATQNDILEETRRNLLNVFRELSKSEIATKKGHPILLLQIRGDEEYGNDNNVEQPLDYTSKNGPSVLFYYLFDDWFSSYGLITQKEHQYGARLDCLRRRIITAPDVNDINELYHVGRQLGVLKRIYESYEQIIDRILKKQKLKNRPDFQHIHSFPTFAQGNVDSQIAPLDATASAAQQGTRSNSSTAGLSSATGLASGLIGQRILLTPAATERFERLRDRIRLYALTEIQECLDSKESLVLQTFNLVAMKESNNVERLTRITILLAKVTILFLPVSLMTAYFSVQIEDMQGKYTTTTYWATFGVIMGLSVVLLIFFGLISGTVEGKIIYRPLSRHVLGFPKRLFQRGKSSKAGTS
ncbi:MAG: hypothetical protein M1833_003191 [Piccolia ochrophora]|nr:MAG: hypothetical protein M1833_003191 [Piccolia ochrophora]